MRKKLIKLNEEEDDAIKKYMKKFKDDHHCYAMVKDELIKKFKKDYTHKQIRQR
ncbi:11317_t:CDS:2, partial [Funneliformis mosseae]